MQLKLRRTLSFCLALRGSNLVGDKTSKQTKLAKPYRHLTRQMVYDEIKIREEI